MTNPGLWVYIPFGFFGVMGGEIIDSIITQFSAVIFIITFFSACVL